MEVSKKQLEDFADLTASAFAEAMSSNEAIASMMYRSFLFELTRREKRDPSSITEDLLVERLSNYISDRMPGYSCKLIKDGGVEIVKVKYRNGSFETINVRGDNIKAIFSKIIAGDTMIGKRSLKSSKYPKETKMITVTDDGWVWHPCYPNNQVKVGISANCYGNNRYVKVNAWGMDDFGVEIAYSCYDDEHLIEMYYHFKHYIYDKITDGTNLEWFYEHGFVKF